MIALTIQSQLEVTGETAFWSVALVLGLLLGVAFAWWRYRSRRALLRRVSELEALSEAGRAIVNAQLDVDTLCDLIAHEAGQVIDTTTFQIGLFDRHYYNILFWTIDGERQATPCTFDLRQNPGVVGWIRDSKQPLLVHDFQKEIDTLPARPRYISDTPPRSAAFIPLISGDRTIGLIAAQSQEPNRFKEADMRRLAILANQAAAAIQNAQLYEQERARATQLELVLEIARQVNTIQDLEEIFDLVVKLIRDTFGFHPVNIFSVEPGSDIAVIRASSLSLLQAGQIQMAPGQGLVGTAVATRQTVLAVDTGLDSRFQAKIGDPEADAVGSLTRSEIVIPLVVNQELLGVLDVHSPHRAVFGPSERTVLEALAAAVAAAIHKASQFAVQREQAWMTTAQLQVADAISRSADLDELLSATTHLVVMLVGVDECGVLLWDDETEHYYGHTIYGASSEAGERFSRTSLAIGDWKPLDAVHVGMEMLTTHKPRPWQQKRGRESETTLIPLVASNEMLGVLYVAQLEQLPERLSQVVRDNLPRRRIELLLELANKAAQAIQSAQLRVAQQEEAWVNTALLQVAEAVNNLINLDEILDTIVRFVPLLAGVRSALILVHDEERESYRAGPSYGLSEMGRGLAESMDIEPEELTTLATLHPASLTPTSTYYTLQLPPWLETIFDTPTAHAFPLNARNRLVGALIVGPSTNGRPLSGRRLNILTGIAHQAAIAVVNNELYKESAERSRLEQELDVARRIQASLIPPGSPAIPGFSVASYWQAARQVSGDFYDFLRFSDESWGIIVADVADKGVPAALFMAVSRTILRTIGFTRQAPAETLTRVNDILLSDTQSDLFVTVFYAVWDPHRRLLTYSNAGHNPPLLLRESGEVRLLRTPGIALGVLPDVTIAQRQLPISPGDTLLIYTDGVTEAMNEAYDEFGLRRLQLAAEDARSAQATEIMTAVTRAIRDFAGDTPQSDDITLVVMKGHEEPTLATTNQTTAATA